MIKSIYPEGWFQEHFYTKPIGNYWCCYGTINGLDRSFFSDTEENARTLALATLQKSKEVYHQENVSLANKLAAAIDEKERAEVLHKRDFKELSDRHRGQLLSVYYMLEAISKTGTHREKETIIMYQKVVLESLINKGDTLPWLQDNLPF